jgi:hypothetical protein
MRMMGKHLTVGVRDSRCNNSNTSLTLRRYFEPDSRALETQRGRGQRSDIHSTASFCDASKDFGICL